jgi:purine-nucleoside phosphorylase
MKQLGVTSLIVTNAAGGINTSFQVGDLMLIEDHINFMGTNSPHRSQRRVFRPPLLRYDLLRIRPLCARLRRRPPRPWASRCTKGVYLGCTGPSYETPREIRAFRTLGADAVGMSTVPEVIAASHCGLQVLAFLSHYQTWPPAFWTSP